MCCLDLQDNNIGERGAIMIAEHLNGQLSTVKELLLGSNRGDDRVAVQLAQPLAEPGCGLETLGLQSNGIGDWGGDTLGKALGSNSSLRVLRLGGNQLDSWGAEGLAEGLASNKSLTHIDLNSNKLDGTGEFQSE